MLYWAVGCLPRAFSGSSSGQRLLCVLDVRLRMASWPCAGARQAHGRAWLSVRCGGVRVPSSFSFEFPFFCAVVVSDIYVLFAWTR